MSKKLTEKQLKFIEVFDGNATQAARLAGYEGNDATLASMGWENLRKPEIVKAIRERGDEEREARVATRVKRQEFWTKIMDDKMADPAARLRASELLGKSEGDFTEKHELSGPNGKPIEVKHSTLTDEQLDAELEAKATKLSLLGHAGKPTIGEAQ